MARRRAGETRDRIVHGLWLITVVLCTGPRLAIGQSCAYVTNLMSDTVSVIDTVANVVTATIPVGHNPNGIVTNAYGGLVCVTNYLSNDVSLIDPATNTVVGRVAVGAGPVGVARLRGTDSPNDDLPESFVYVANRTDHTVSVIEVGTAHVMATIDVDPSPDGIAVGYTSHGATAYVTHSVSAGSVSVIDMATNTVTAKIPVGSRPGRVAFGAGSVYVTNFGSFNLATIDSSTNTVTATIGLSLKPSNIAVTTDDRSIYVTNADAPIVSIISARTNAVVAAITVGAQPAAVVHTKNSAGHAAYTYVANSGSDTVSVINRGDKNHVVATIPVGRMPFALAVGAGNCRAAAIPTLTPLTTPSGAATASPSAAQTPTLTSTVTMAPTGSPACTATAPRTATPLARRGSGCAIDGATPGRGGGVLPWLILLLGLRRHRRQR